MDGVWRCEVRALGRIFILQRHPRAEWPINFRCCYATKSGWGWSVRSQRHRAWSCLLCPLPRQAEGRVFGVQESSRFSFFHFVASVTPGAMQFYVKDPSSYLLLAWASVCPVLPRNAHSGLNRAGGWLAIVLAVVRNSGLDGDLSRNLLAFCFVDIFFFLFLHSWCGTSTRGTVDCYRKALPG